MKPGRELDALIAEKVMNGTSKQEGFFVQSVDHDAKTITAGVELRYLPYSTDMAAAWEVVLSLTGPKCVFSLSTLHDTKLNKYYWVARAEFPSSPYCEFEVCDTAPEAICLVALKVKLIEEIDALGREFFNSDETEYQIWLQKPNEYLFNSAPISIVLRGDGELLVKWLKEQLGKASK